MEFDTTVETYEDFENEEELSFGAEMAKAAAISVATTIGTVAGMIVVGFAVEKIQKFTKKRKARKEENTENTKEEES